MKKKKNKKARQRLIIKLALCLFYLLIIFILCFSAFKLLQKDQEIVPWKIVSRTTQYSYIKISQMSEAFAEIKNEGKTIHYVIEEEKTGAWHTYLLAINKKDYNKYKNIIDYTYQRTTTIPKSIKVYGYPVFISDNIKSLAIKNISKFLPVENQVVLDNNNFEQYMTNTYLDTTKSEVHVFNKFILILLLLALILLILLIFTILDKDKIVNEVDEIIEAEEAKIEKKNRKKTKKVNNKKKNIKHQNKKNISKSKNKKKQTDDDIEII